MKLYGIWHGWDVEGGLGMAVSAIDLIAITESEEVAKEYVEKWSNEHVYDTPYDELSCGMLFYEELPAAITDCSKAPYELDKLLSWAFNPNDPLYNDDYDGEEE